jgi:hypothetical protein
MLTQAEIKELLRYDPTRGVFTWLVAAGKRVKAGSVAGTLLSDGYCRIQIKGKRYKAHRLAWLYVHGQWPSNQIDHRNRIRDDNRIGNLREATTMQNAMNRSTNTSGVPGVSWYRGMCKWQAQIWVGQKPKHLGYFANIEDAAEARRMAELKYFGVNAL